MSSRIILVGKQGAGKGTQADKLSLHYSMPHISTGDLFRAAIASGTELGFRVKSIIDSGHLAPDEITNEVVDERLKRADVANGFIMDGYPRNVSQAGVLDEMLSPNEIDLVVDLEIPSDVAVERLASRRVCKKGHIYGAQHMPKNPLVCDIDGTEVVQRDDDKPDSIRKRLAIYEEQTSPILSHYRHLGKVITVSGLGSTDEVFDRLTAAIDDSVASRTS